MTQGELAKVARGRFHPRGGIASPPGELATCSDWSLSYSAFNFGLDNINYL